MPTDFRYVPTSGSLSGKSFEEQTERAFNELGEHIDESGEAAGAALETAQNAQNTADQALQTVQTAADAANAAQTAAAAAEAAAGGAVATAHNALTLAGEASLNANLALAASGEAFTTATEAQTAAQAAQETAAEMDGRITAAEGLAQAAQSRADDAMGRYIVTPTARPGTPEIPGDPGDPEADPPLPPTAPIPATDPAQWDANDFYWGAGKVYLVASDDPDLAALPALNLPPELAPPIYFLAEVNHDPEGNAPPVSVTQTAWDTTAQRVFTRCGSTNHSAPENPVTTWTPWNSVSVPQTVQNVDVVVDPEGQPAGTYLVITFETESGEEAAHINLTQVLSGVYTAGNGGLVVTDDFKILLNLNPNGAGLELTPEGLSAKTATNQTAGIVQGNAEAPGKVSVGPDGEMTVNGWSGKQNALTLPLPVAQGGTEAATASAARVNLGAASGYWDIVDDAAFDFNAAVTPGRYWLYTGIPTTFTNAPPGAGSVLFLEVSIRSVAGVPTPTTVFQTVQDRAGNHWSRDRVNATDWTAWAALATQTWAAPRPNNTALAVGNLRPISAAVGAAITLPAGGTWAYLIIGLIGGGFSVQLAGIAPGGTTIGTAMTNQALGGFIWRIA